MFAVFVSVLALPTPHEPPRLRKASALRSRGEAGTGPPAAKPGAPPSPVPEREAEAAEVIEVGPELRVQGPHERAGSRVTAAIFGAHTFGAILFAHVPKGPFRMGSKEDNPSADDDEKPQFTFDIPYDFWISRFPVTNAQFAQYAERVHPAFKPPSDWQERSNHPVVGVSWNDAIAYCRWLNQEFASELGVSRFRLPTEAEWEKAARGEYGNEWPWGNTFDPARCNSRESGIDGATPVGQFSPQGDGPYGAADMAGNVWEWCQSLIKKYPYKPDDGREDLKAGGPRVLRGGSFDDDSVYVRCAFRDGSDPYLQGWDVGVRLVVSPS